MFNDSKILEMFKRKQTPLDFGIFFFSHISLAVYNFIPSEGPVPDVKVGVADSAYTRASDELKKLLYLPEKIPDDGSNPRVRFSTLFFVVALTQTYRVPN